MREHYPTAELVYVHDVGEGLGLLTEGTVDAVIGDEPVMLYYAKELDVEDRITTIETWQAFWWLWCWYSAFWASPAWS